MGPDYRPNADTKGYNVSEPIGYIDQALPDVRTSALVHAMRESSYY